MKSLVPRILVKEIGKIFNNIPALLKSPPIENKEEMKTYDDIQREIERCENLGFTKGAIVQRLSTPMGQRDNAETLGVIKQIMKYKSEGTTEYKPLDVLFFTPGWTLKMTPEQLVLVHEAKSWLSLNQLHAQKQRTLRSEEHTS